MTELKVMTLNIHNSLRSASFDRRIRSISAMAAFHDPDLIGVQELTDDMINKLPEMSETYAFFGKRRGSSRQTDERCCILYRKTRFRFISGGTFWLSDTPEEAGSRYAGSMFPRIVTLAELEDLETGSHFTFANTHLDHLFPPVRTKQAEVLRNILKEKRTGDFLILTGDFNCSFPAEAVRLLTADEDLALKDTAPDDGRSTIRNFIQAGASHYRPIDHILISRNLTSVKSEIISGLYMGVYPSDHCPVLTFIETESHFAEPAADSAE